MDPWTTKRASSAGRACGIIRKLDAEWSTICQQAATLELFGGWTAERPMLSTFSSPQDLLDAIWDLLDGSDQQDALLAEILREATARHNAPELRELARRIVLQALLPRVARLAAGPFYVRERAERETIAIGSTFEAIAEYPLDRLPRKLYPNLAIHAMRIAYRDSEEIRKVHRYEVRCADLSYISPVHDEGTGAAEAVQLLNEAVRCGVITAEEATRLLEPEEAAEEYSTTSVVPLRRARAIRALRRFALVPSEETEHPRVPPGEAA